jgi:hypothetical protein
MSDLTPRKRKPYQRIWRKESAPLMQEISNSLNAEAVRLLAAIIRNSRHKPRGRRWNFE